MTSIWFPNNKYPPNTKNYLPCFVLGGEGGGFSIRRKGLFQHHGACLGISPQRDTETLRDHPVALHRIDLVDEKGELGWAQWGWQRPIGFVSSVMFGVFVPMQNPREMGNLISDCKDKV